MQWKDRANAVQTQGKGQRCLTCPIAPITEAQAHVTHHPSSAASSPLRTSSSAGRAAAPAADSAWATCGAHTLVRVKQYDAIEKSHSTRVRNGCDGSNHLDVSWVHRSKRCRVCPLRDAQREALRDLLRNAGGAGAPQRVHQHRHDPAVRACTRPERLGRLNPVCLGALIQPGQQPGNVQITAAGAPA